MLGPSSFSVFGASWPLLGALWARFGRVRASILEVFGAHFHQISKLLEPTFSATLALCWSIFFTKIWFGMGWWGYAKRKELLVTCVMLIWAVAATECCCIMDGAKGVEFAGLHSSYKNEHAFKDPTSLHGALSKWCRKSHACLKRSSSCI